MTCVRKGFNVSLPVCTSSVTNRQELTVNKASLWLLLGRFLTSGCRIHATAALVWRVIPLASLTAVQLIGKGWSISEHLADLSKLMPKTALPLMWHSLQSPPTPYCAAHLARLTLTVASGTKRSHKKRRDCFYAWLGAHLPTCSLFVHYSLTAASDYLIPLKAAVTFYNYYAVELACFSHFLVALAYNKSWKYQAVFCAIAQSWVSLIISSGL